MVSNPVECDFTLSSLLEDTASHSLSLPCLEWEVPRKFLLYMSELISPPLLGFEKFEERVAEVCMYMFGPTMGLGKVWEVVWLW